MKTLIRNIASLIIMVASVTIAKAQSNENFTVVQCKVDNGDTILFVNIEEIYVFPQNKFRNSREARLYNRLVRNVKVAYPYSVLVKNKLDEVNRYLAALETEKERKEYIDIMEVQLRNEFEEELKNLTITQGRILIKLVDRQTGDTSYELVKELKGSINAFFWQTVARLFGSTLKAEYDPLGEDKQIEEIVQLIENGQI